MENKIYKLHYIFLCLILISFGLIGCAHYPINPPIERLDGADDYRFSTFAGENGENLGNDFIILSFSGGGTRAAALAYGVLDAMKDEKIGNGETVLDEVNVISSVSGGSFTAAYYALYGKEKFFKDFRKDMLERKMRTQLLMKLATPLFWPSLLSSKFGRSEGAADYYDKLLFKDHTFAELPREWPFIVINATDMSRGAHFSFIQEDFDRMCSDLSGVKISRAVAASSAVPTYLTPVTFKNYPKSTCGYTTPDWVIDTLAGGPDKNPQMYTRAKTWKSYEDVDARPYVHLLDGAVADNIGIRSVAFALRTDTWELLKVRDAMKRVERIALIIVDAEPRGYPDFDSSGTPPGFFASVLTGSTGPLKNYSSDTVELVHDNFKRFKRYEKNYELAKKMCQEIASGRCKGIGQDKCKREEVEACLKRIEMPRRWRPYYPEFYLIHINFENVKDLEVREKIGKIPTDFQLSKDDVALLIKVAHELLDGSEEYQRFLRDVREDLRKEKA